MNNKYNLLLTSQSHCVKINTYRKSELITEKRQSKKVEKVVDRNKLMW